MNGHRLIREVVGYHPIAIRMPPGLLHQCHADTESDAAVNLTFGKLWIVNSPAIENACDTRDTEPADPLIELH